MLTHLVLELFVKSRRLTKARLALGFAHQPDDTGEQKKAPGRGV
jgi:hypothetical protein